MRTKLSTKPLANKLLKAGGSSAPSKSFRDIAGKIGGALTALLLAAVLWGVDFGSATEIGQAALFGGSFGTTFSLKNIVRAIRSRTTGGFNQVRLHWRDGLKGGVGLFLIALSVTWLLSPEAIPSFLKIGWFGFDGPIRPLVFLLTGISLYWTALRLPGAKKFEWSSAVFKAGALAIVLSLSLNDLLGAELPPAFNNLLASGFVDSFVLILLPAIVIFIGILFLKQQPRPRFIGAVFALLGAGTWYFLSGGNLPVLADIATSLGGLGVDPEQFLAVFPIAALGMPGSATGPARPPLAGIEFQPTKFSKVIERLSPEDTLELLALLREAHGGLIPVYSTVQTRYLDPEQRDLLGPRIVAELIENGKILALVNDEGISHLVRTRTGPLKGYTVRLRASPLPAKGTGIQKADLMGEVGRILELALEQHHKLSMADGVLSVEGDVPLDFEATVNQLNLTLARLSEYPDGVVASELERLLSGNLRILFSYPSGFLEDILPKMSSSVLYRVAYSVAWRYTYSELSDIEKFNLLRRFNGLLAIAPLELPFATAKEAKPFHDLIIAASHNIQDQQVLDEVVQSILQRDTQGHVHAQLLQTLEGGLELSPQVELVLRLQKYWNFQAKDSVPRFARFLEESFVRTFAHDLDDIQDRIKQLGTGVAVGSPQRVEYEDLYMERNRWEGVIGEVLQRSLASADPSLNQIPGGVPL